MKKLLFSIFFAAGFIFLNQAAAQNPSLTKIGELINGVPTITYNQNQLKQEWQSYLSLNSEISVSFATIEITQEGTFYALRGRNADNSIKSALKLVLSGNDLYRVNGFTHTVSCSGCTSGCSPWGNDTGWECKDPCTDCKKTETITF